MLTVTFSPFSEMLSSLQERRTSRSPTPRKPPTPTMTLSTLPSLPMNTDLISPIVSFCAFWTFRPISLRVSALAEGAGMALVAGAVAAGGVAACCGLGVWA